MVYIKDFIFASIAILTYAYLYIICDISNLTLIAALTYMYYIWHKHIKIKLILLITLSVIWVITNDPDLILLIIYATLTIFSWLW